VAPSVVRADHEARLQTIENNGGARTAVGFVVYKLTLPPKNVPLS
jgi:hypothetical protein